jgi:hypothetical protein
MSKKHCLDDPPKPFRNALTKRRKADREKASKKLTPALVDAMAEYFEHGQPVPGTSKQKYEDQLGYALVDALEASWDPDALQCPSCAFMRSERQRKAQCEAVCSIYRYHTGI